MLMTDPIPVDTPHDTSAAQLRSIFGGMTTQLCAGVTVTEENVPKASVVAIGSPLASCMRKVPSSSEPSGRARAVQKDERPRRQYSHTPQWGTKVWMT